MQRFIDNLMELGFGGLFLWFIFILIVYYLVNRVIKGVEIIMKRKHDIYMYDVVWLCFLVAVFIYGIYSYR
jgi:uncharacterized membrane protein YhaH (DUF805 family)